MKTIKIDNCTKCNPIGKGIWKDDIYASTTTESTKIYTGKDEWYCRNKKVKKGGYFGCKYITTAVENCSFITIPKWCPLEDYIELCKYKCSCGHSFEMKIQKVGKDKDFRLEYFICDNCGKKYIIHNNILKVIRRPANTNNPN